MKYEKFIIENYKGITKLELELNLKPDLKIYTLVGLNESGKSTILEAINNLYVDIPLDKRHLLIPKSKAGGFTGRSRVSAILSFSEDDKMRIFNFLKLKFKFKELIIENVEFTLSYEYNNSEPVPNQNSSRSFKLQIKYKKTKKESLHSVETSHLNELWNELIRPQLFPEIIFYKDFGSLGVSGSFAGG